MKEKVIKYYECLLGQCGYLLTTTCAYQYVCYAETGDELILDAYEGLPEDFWHRLQIVPKKDIICHFTHFNELKEYLKGDIRLLTIKQYNQLQENYKVIKTVEFNKKDDLVEWVYHCPPDIGESYAITRVNKKKYVLEVTQNGRQ